MKEQTEVTKQWQQLRSENPKLRIRDAARQLGVSEADLVATDINNGNIRLNNDFKGLLMDAESLGYVMALTRNDHCVHERHGIYHKASFNGDMGLLVNPDIDLRLFMNHWHFGFAVNENGRFSFQFFDQDGEAVHKIYLTEKSNMEAWNKLIGVYKSENQSTLINTVPITGFLAKKLDSELDITGFQNAWRELKDTHQFHGLLKTFGLSRIQAMRFAPEGFSEEISMENFKGIIRNVSNASVEIMVFTGSRGCIQIHTGEAKNLLQTGPWFNILDPEFNMHLREDAIDSIWMVKKPTTDGVITSLEVYSADGNIIVQFFGKRKPGIPESESWRNALKINALA
jgi:putative hemin transport protein